MIFDSIAWSDRRSSAVALRYLHVNNVVDLSLKVLTLYRFSLHSTQ